MTKLIVFAALIALLYGLGKRALAPRGAMSAGEAAKLLAVAVDADPDVIIAAHRRLIAKVHPDAGGSAELAARVNQARDTLIGSLPRSSG